MGNYLVTDDPDLAIYLTLTSTIFCGSVFLVPREAILWEQTPLRKGSSAAH